jgi:hypothetical protein
MAPRNNYCAGKSEIRQIFFWAVLGILFSFPRKAMNTNVGDNFMAHNLDTEFALFGVQTWEIWCCQGRAANQESLDEAEFMVTKFLSLPRKILCKARWRRVGGGPSSGELVEDAPNWSEMLPTSRERDILPVMVLTEVLSLPRLESWPS